jgi:hypothetical protein
VEINSRDEVLKMLRAAVTTATAGELQRAVEFLRFARQVRTGKHQLRRGSRGRAHARNKFHNVRTG